MELTPIDRILYRKYKKAILKQMAAAAKSDWNLSKRLTALLGPPLPPHVYIHNNTYDGFLEAKQHSRNGGNEFTVQAVERLNELLMLDKWLNDHSGLQFENVPTGLGEKELLSFDQYVKNHLWITPDNFKTIFPPTCQDNIIIMYPKTGNDGKNRLYLPPAIFKGRDSNGNEVCRFDQLFREISQYIDKNEKTINATGSVQGALHDCLFVIAISYKSNWGKDGKLNFPNTLLNTFYKGTHLHRYCNYYIVVNCSHYCNLSAEENKFLQLDKDVDIEMVRTDKKYAHKCLQDNAMVEHILIFDNFQEEKVINGASKNATMGGR